ncbi:MAG: 3-phosphoshikimate 1-carboxyvinyltransferase, partial [Nitrospirota bacterium]
AKELSRIGVKVEENPDGMVIHGGKPMRATDVQSHGDHRVAMAMAVAGLIAEGGKDGMRINDTACINTSFPGFMELLESVR